MDPSKLLMKNPFVKNKIKIEKVFSTIQDRMVKKFTCQDRVPHGG